MEYKIKIYVRAQADLRELVEYINQFYETTALAYYDEVVAAIKSLNSMPERCPLARDHALKLKGYHWLQVKKHIIFFVIKGKTVQIRRILYNKRQYIDIL